MFVDGQARQSGGVTGGWVYEHENGEANSVLHMSMEADRLATAALHITSDAVCYISVLGLECHLCF